MNLDLDENLSLSLGTDGLPIGEQQVTFDEMDESWKSGEVDVQRLLDLLPTAPIDSVSTGPSDGFSSLSNLDFGWELSDLNTTNSSLIGINAF